MTDKKGETDIEKILNREIKERKKITKAFTTKFEDIEKRLKKDTEEYTKLKKTIKNGIKEIKKSMVPIFTKFEEMETKLKEDTEEYTKLKKTIKNGIKEIRKTKSEITSYTLQLITIIVGVFTLITTVTFFGLNREFLKDVYLVNYLFLIFVIILVIWFIFWFKKEKPLT